MPDRAEAATFAILPEGRRHLLFFFNTCLLIRAVAEQIIDDLRQRSRQLSDRFEIRRISATDLAEIGELAPMLVEGPGRVKQRVWPMTAEISELDRLCSTVDISDGVSNDRPSLFLNIGPVSFGLHGEKTLLDALFHSNLVSEQSLANFKPLPLRLTRSGERIEFRIADKLVEWFYDPGLLYPVISHWARILFVCFSRSDAIFHAANIRAGDYQFVLFGPKGAGKSTLSRRALENGDQCFSDELVGAYFRDQKLVLNNYVNPIILKERPNDESIACLKQANYTVLQVSGFGSRPMFMVSSPSIAPFENGQIKPEPFFFHLKRTENERLAAVQLSPSERAQAVLQSTAHLEMRDDSICRLEALVNFLFFGRVARLYTANRDKYTDIRKCLGHASCAQPAPDHTAHLKKDEDDCYP